MKIDTVLSKRELDVMKILWKMEKALTASEISSISGISISTVHTAINKLLSKNMIKVDEIIFSGKVLCRCYRPTISAMNYDMRKLINLYKGTVNKAFSASNFVAALLGQEEDSQKVMDELDELEKMIKEKKKELENKSKPSD